MSVECRSQQARDRMLGFLGRSFRPWTVVLDGRDGDRYIGDPTKDLDYARGGWQVGFNYGAWGVSLGDPEYEYYWAVLRWIALQVGRRRGKFRLQGHEGTYSFPEPVPYTVYDGDDRWPVLTSRPHPRLRWCWVDRLGMHRDRGTVAEHHSNLVHELLVRPLPERDGSVVREFSLDERAVEILGGTPPTVDLAGMRLFQIPRERRGVLVRKLLWPEVLERLRPVREEMARLDALWRE